MTYARVLCLVQVVMVVQLDTLDTLPLSRPENKPETFGYRSGIKFELVVAWDLNTISTNTESCTQLDSHYFIDCAPKRNWEA